MSANCFSFWGTLPDLYRGFAPGSHWGLPSPRPLSYSLPNKSSWRRHSEIIKIAANGDENHSVLHKKDNLLQTRMKDSSTFIVARHPLNMFCFADFSTDPECEHSYLSQSKRQTTQQSGASLQTMQTLQQREAIDPGGQNMLGGIHHRL